MAAQIAILTLATILTVATAWLARRSDRDPASRPAFLLAWGVLLAGFVGYALLSYLSLLDIMANQPALAEEAHLDANAPVRGLAGVILAAVSALYLWLFVRSRRLRGVFTGLLPTLTAVSWDGATPWKEQVRGFDLDSAVHAFGLGTAQLLVLQTLTDFVIAGGQAGLAVAGLNQTDVILSSAFTAILLLSGTLAGVGLGQDRSWPQVLARLGLRWPTTGEMVAGAGMAVTLLAFQFCAGTVWVTLAPQDVFEQQTQLSQAIAGSVTGLPAAFLLALFSSLGEEIAFRGALQPVAGLWPTAVLFALTHTQYQFTPALLIILAVGIVFGWTRKHYGTTAAIAAHFLYNFSLLALSVAAGQLLGQ